jgi:hypothetical protein
MPPFHRLCRPALLSALAVLPWLAGCADTIVFGAQREIDVAISLNEDVAEPVQVNIGLNSQIASLIPPIAENDDSTSSTGITSLAAQHFNPEGEAASIFSGFRYTSSSMLEITPASPRPKYDAEIRSQFASGAAAVILASDPEAVAKVVDVAITFDRNSSFMSPPIVAWRANLQSQIDGLSEPKVSELYLSPPTTNAKIEELIASVKGDHAAECDASDLCRRDMLRIRIQDLGTTEQLQKWDAAFAS